MTIGCCGATVLSQFLTHPISIMDCSNNHLMPVAVMVLMGCKTFNRFSEISARWQRKPLPRIPVLRAARKGIICRCRVVKQVKGAPNYELCPLPVEKNNAHSIIWNSYVNGYAAWRHVADGRVPFYRHELKSSLEWPAASEYCEWFDIPSI